MTKIPAIGATVWFVPKEGRAHPRPERPCACRSGIVESATCHWTKIAGLEKYQVTSRLFHSEREILAEIIRNTEIKVFRITKYLDEDRDRLKSLK